MKTILIIAFLVAPLLIFGQRKSKEMIYFNSDSWEPLVSSEGVLNKVLLELHQSSDSKVVINGHTDNVGSVGYNEQLSRKRAEYVYQFFAENHIQPTQISINYFGETSPVQFHDKEMECAKNRRVELLLIKEDSEKVLVEEVKVHQPVKLPDNQVVEVAPEGCRAHFSGALIGSTYNDMFFSKLYQPDSYSELVSAGEYKDNSRAFPKAVENTFDGIGIDADTRVIIFSKKNFKGDTLMDIKGPAIINNGMYRQSLAKRNEMNFEGKFNDLYDQENIIWTKVNMMFWSYGSVKVLCKEED